MEKKAYLLKWQLLDDYQPDIEGFKSQLDNYYHNSSCSVPQWAYDLLPKIEAGQGMLIVLTQAGVFYSVATAESVLV